MKQSPSKDRATPGVADWLSLAAAPTFAFMALASGVLSTGMPDPLCTTAGQGMTMNPMLLMYVLMSVFHLAPWLRLLDRWRIGRRLMTAAERYLP